VQVGFTLGTRGGGRSSRERMVFESLFRSSPRRRASPCLAESVWSLSHYSAPARAGGLRLAWPRALARRHEAHTGLSAQSSLARQQALLSAIGYSSARRHEAHTGLNAQSFISPTARANTGLYFQSPSTPRHEAKTG